MRVLISGGLGFIGGAIAQELRLHGHAVRLMDNRAGGSQSTSGYIKASVLNRAECSMACAGVDVVIHSAAIHDSKVVDSNPFAAIEINVRGTNNLFDAAVAAGARRFIYMSSAKVYGDPERLPSAENATLEPRETYALSKVAGEHRCHLRQAESGIEVVIIRPFSVYGPGQELGSGYIGMVLASLLGEKGIELPGHPEFRRDFVHIEDVTRLTMATVTADALPGVTILNSGAGEQHSLSQLLAYSAEIAGYELPIGFRTPNPQTLTRTHACMRRAKQLLGYEPAHKLREGLADTIQWFTSTGVPAKMAR